MKTRGTLTTGLLALAAMVGCGQKGTPGGDVSLQGSAAIVNGTTVVDGDPVLKSTVGLVMKMAQGQALCTGTLLSDKVVLTAAHCVTPDVLKVAVVFTRDFDKVSHDDVRMGLTFTQNPLWGNKDASGRGDLALVLFKGGIPDGFAAAEMIPATDDINDGEDVIVTGFGVSDGAAHSGSGVLRRTVLKVLGLASPTEVITDGHERSVCFGDSGGPSYVERSGKLYVWGVASAVTNDTCSEYAIHTDVVQYEDWIAKTAASLTAQYDDLSKRPAPPVPGEPPPVAPKPPEGGAPKQEQAPTGAAVADA